MKYAVIKNEKVTQIIEADQSFIDEHFPGSVDVSGKEIEEGDIYTGGSFINTKPVVKLSTVKTEAKRAVRSITDGRQSQLIAEGVYLILKQQSDAESKAWVGRYEALESGIAVKDKEIDDASDEAGVKLVTES